MRRLLQARRLEHSLKLTLHLAQLQFRAHEGLHPRSRRLTRLTRLTPSANTAGRPPAVLTSAASRLTPAVLT